MSSVATFTRPVWAGQGWVLNQGGWLLNRGGGIGLVRGRLRAKYHQSVLAPCATDLGLQATTYRVQCVGVWEGLWVGEWFLAFYAPARPKLHEYCRALGVVPPVDTLTSVRLG